MQHPQPNNPLHGITLKLILTALVEKYGWEGLAKKIPVTLNRFGNQKFFALLELYVSADGAVYTSRIQ